MREILKRKFENRLIVGDNCWTLSGKPNTYGYHFIHFKGKKWYAHRLSLEWKLGRKLSNGEEACHSCDNRACVNPDHLWVGSHYQNMRDGYDKGRIKPIVELLKKKKTTTPCQSQFE